MFANPDAGSRVVREEQGMPWEVRFRMGLDAVRDIVGKVWPYLLAGIAVGAGIHGYVPENFLASVMGSGAWWSVPLAVLLGIPLYSNAAGIIPIVITSYSIHYTKLYEEGDAGLVREKRATYGIMGRRGVRIGVTSALVAASVGGVVWWKGSRPAERKTSRNNFV